jgi:hypothetical protein
MQFFGLISILIAVAIGLMWVVSSMSGTEIGIKNPDDTTTKTTYQEAIDSAEDVVGALEARN